MDAIKKVALHLYPLNKSDKTWLLDQLASEERQNVDYFLRELDSLGIPKDRELVRQAINTKQSKQKKEQPLYAKYVAQLNQFNSIEVYEAISEEPNLVIAFILSIYGWRWKEGVLALFTIERQNQIHSLLSKKQPDVKDKVKAALLNGLLQKLASDLQASALKTHKLVESVRPIKKKTFGNKLMSLLRGHRG